MARQFSTISSVLLEQQFNEVLGLRRLVLAMHATLERLDPRYKTGVQEVLEAQPIGKDSSDVAALEEAKKTLLELRAR